MRSLAREAVLRAIFACEFSNTNEKSARMSIYRNLDLNNDDVVFAERLVSVVFTKKNEIGRIIEKYSLGYSPECLFPVDKCLLKMGIAEILFFDDVPDKVAANEETNLARKYSVETSPSFVNGILAAVIINKEECLAEVNNG